MLTNNPCLWKDSAMRDYFDPYRSLEQKAARETNIVGVIAGMLLGAFLCLCGVAALTLLLLSFERLVPW